MSDAGRQTPPIVRILVDADACPVKEEVYRVARRLQVPVTIVANSPIRIPREPLISQVVVGDKMDEADDAIAAMADEASVEIGRASCRERVCLAG